MVLMITDSDIQEFFYKIDQLDTGERAALRREAGNVLWKAKGKAISAFYRCKPMNVSVYQESQWFACACLRCLWDAGIEGNIPLEKVISQLVHSGDISNSVLHRVELLMDTQWDEAGYMIVKLTRLVKLIRQKSDRILIDFYSLLKDVCYWNSESQNVQRKWARTIFSTYTNNEKEE